MKSMSPERRLYLRVDTRLYRAKSGMIVTERQRGIIYHTVKGMTMHIKGNDVTTMKAVDVLNLCAKRQAHKKGISPERKGQCR